MPQESQEDSDEDLSMEGSHASSNDPYQEAAEDNTLRGAYMKLQEDEKLLDPNSVDIDYLIQKMRAANQLCEKYKWAMSPAMMRYDAKFLATVSSVATLKARQIRAKGAFNCDKYVANLVKFMGSDQQIDGEQIHAGDEEMKIDDDMPLEWDLIGRKALAKSRRIPVMDFMLGPLCVTPKKRARVKKKKEEQEMRPHELTAQDIKMSDNETSRNVIQVYKVLQSHDGPINLFKLIINPDNFGQSAENLFYLSFLIRDDKVRLEYNTETDNPLLYLADAPTYTNYLEEGLYKKQMIMELDIDTWKRAKEAYNITQPMIPTRSPARTRLSDKWYSKV